MAEEHPLPLLSIEDTKKVVNELENALDTQRDWLKNFQAMLACRTRPEPEDLKANTHQKSGFGLWYYKKASRPLKKHPDFAAVGKCHLDMHDRARSLAEALDSSADIAPGLYDAFMMSADRFEIALRKLHGEARGLLSETDPLTGVSTRMAMLSRLDQERARVKRSDAQSCIGMADLDHFKVVNDTYGHQAGDKVLQSIAGYMLEHLRQYDQVYRYGGEEFLLLLPNTPVDRARVVLDRLRRGLHRQRIPIKGDIYISMTVSFGVTALKSTVSVKTTIGRADKALYAAKAAGRNRVLVWESIKGKSAPAAGRKKAPAGPTLIPVVQVVDPQSGTPDRERSQPIV